MKNDIKYLEWDSLFFDKKIGQITIERELDILQEDKSKYDLIYVFSKNGELNLNLVDKKVIYLIDDLISYKDEINNIELFQDSQNNHADLLNLALQSGKHSRFKSDSNFKDEDYKKLYTEWIKKSISKDLATDIIIKKSKNKIIGFATLARKTDELADIGLVAVDLAYRGKGLAKEIIMNTLKLAARQGYKKIQVVTQLDNKPANILYEKVGFKKDNLTYIYHIWNNDSIQ
jgi:dTDP-4-amino-4,6-dideoxy-D-galactose acyltransferase